MCTNFGLAGIPGTRLKVCGWGGGGSHTHYCITPVPILGAGALMLNAWDWTVTINTSSIIKGDSRLWGIFEALTQACK